MIFCVRSLPGRSVFGTMALTVHVPGTGAAEVAAPAWLGATAMRLADTSVNVHEESDAGPRCGDISKRTKPPPRKLNVA